MDMEIKSTPEYDHEIECRKLDKIPYLIRGIKGAGVFTFRG